MALFFAFFFGAARFTALLMRIVGFCFLPVFVLFFLVAIFYAHPRRRVYHWLGLIASTRITVGIFRLDNYNVHRFILHSVPQQLPLAVSSLEDPHAMNKEQLRARVEEVGIIPVIRTSSAEDARFAVEEISHGGIPVIEVTMTVPGRH